MVELDEKYCDVIVNRTALQLQTTESFFLVRDGQKLRYSEVVASTDKQ